MYNYNWKWIHYYNGLFLISTHNAHHFTTKNLISSIFLTIQSSAKIKIILWPTIFWDVSSSSWQALPVQTFVAEPFHNSCHPFVSLEDRGIHTENVQDKTGLELVIHLYSLDRRNIIANHNRLRPCLIVYLLLFLCTLVVRSTWALSWLKHGVTSTAKYLWAAQKIQNSWTFPKPFLNLSETIHEPFWDHPWTFPEPFQNHPWTLPKPALNLPWHFWNF